ncbi:MAG: type II toxin-antitoxin system PemK/MazF family toxin [Acidimicrobiia bacterium]|nr:type II toxin-antitoxin system PemK/MazF family toxin [Acidimicrobiia bacterium]
MRRGDVLVLPLPKGVGHEQHGRRYGVVVQADALLPRSVVLIAPTSQSAKPASFRPEIEVAGERTRVLVEQVGAVDVQRLGDLAGRLSPEEQWGIDAALLTVLGLD